MRARVRADSPHPAARTCGVLFEKHKWTEIPSNWMLEAQRHPLLEFEAVSEPDDVVPVTSEAAKPAASAPIPKKRTRRKRQTKRKS